jgi:hypothetical protein
MYIQVHEKITKHVTKLVGLRPPHGSYSGHPAEVDRFSKIIHVGERKCEREETSPDLAGSLRTLPRRAVPIVLLIFSLLYYVSRWKG